MYLNTSENITVLALVIEQTLITYEIVDTCCISNLYMAMSVYQHLILGLP